VTFLEIKKGGKLDKGERSLKKTIDEKKVYYEILQL